jgi:hypothetical protein
MHLFLTPLLAPALLAASASARFVIYADEYVISLGTNTIADGS